MMLSRKENTEKSPKIRVQKAVRNKLISIYIFRRYRVMTRKSSTAVNDRKTNLKIEIILQNK